MEEIQQTEKLEPQVFSQGSDSTAITANENSFNDKWFPCYSIDQEFIDIIETYEFSRLKEISQLGGYRFFDSRASHTRYDHCIGTMKFADRILEGIKKNSTEFEAAALCHDLGHGPFSHTFDNNFIQVRFPYLEWTHEECSTKLLEYLIDKNSIDHFDKYDVRIIQNFIVGKNYPLISEVEKLLPNPFPMDTKGWMFDIVNNKRNSLDIDKFDYLKRDTQNLCLKGYDFDEEILLNEARVIDSQICYPLCAADTIKDLFEARYKMFKDIYCSPISKAIDLQICDIFVESNEYYRYDEVIQDFEQYSNLTDNILNDILNNDDSSLDTARVLTKNLYNGDLYTPILQLPIDSKLEQTYREITPEQIACFSNSNLKPSSIRVDINKINYGMGNANPLNSVRFYSDSSHMRSKDRSLKLEDPDKVISRYKIETYFNVYCTDNYLQKEVEKATCAALKQLAGCELTKSVLLHGF